MDTIDILLKDTASQSLWVSETIAQALPPKQAHTQLGQEYQIIVFDCRDGFDPDALGAVIGTLCGGGVLFLITPALDEWQALKHSLYLQMLKHVLLQHPALLCLQQHQPLPDLTSLAPVNTKQSAVATPYKTADQQQTVTAIYKNFTQASPLPMVLIADRGRGKSSSLGLAAARLLSNGINTILLTAPRLSICEQLFYHAEKTLIDCQRQRGKLSTKNASIAFLAPDALLETKPSADILIVDEAAAIPLPMLKQMLQHYPAIIFSSTLYGYEGTGRGFILKFFNILDRHTEKWIKLSMKAPVRWAENDPLESWANELLCLHAELEKSPDISEIAIDQLKVECLDKNQIIHNKTQQNALFALLVSAHYRTRPSDFQFLLDNTSVRIYTLNHQSQILAAVVINQEGGFDKSLAADIYKGRRRPAGHLLAQTLCFHAGIEEAAQLHYSRIMRIAVHPDLQRRGLGSHLMKNVIQQEASLTDMIGSSFAATAGLITFWKQLGFELVRTGFSRDHVSASHSVVMLQTLSDKHLDVFHKLRLKFQNGIDWWLEDSLKDIQADIKSLLTDEAIVSSDQISPLDWQDIHSFAHYSRGYETCSPALHKLIEQYAEQLNLLDEDDQQIINCRIKHRLDWNQTVRQCGLKGKHQALKNLRLAIGKLLQLIN